MCERHLEGRQDASEVEVRTGHFACVFSRNFSSCQLLLHDHNNRKTTWTVYGIADSKPSVKGSSITGVEFGLADCEDGDAYQASRLIYSTFSSALPPSLTHRTASTNFVVLSATCCIQSVRQDSWKCGTDPSYAVPLGPLRTVPARNCLALAPRTPVALALR